MNPTQTPYSAIRNMKWGFRLLALLLVIFCMAFTWVSWQTEKEESSDFLSSIAELGGKSLDTYFVQYESAFKLLGQQLLDERGTVNAETARVLLKRFQDAHPGLQVVNLVRPDGQILATTMATPRNALPSVGKVPSFMQARHALLQGKSFDLGQPSIGVLVKEWVIPMRYGVKDQEGRLLFILHAALPLSQQQILWQDMALPNDTAIGVVRDDGYLLSRYPAPKELDLATVYAKPRTGALINVLRERQFPVRGLVEGTASLSGPDHIFAFRRLSGYPLTFFITTPIANLQTAWWKHASFSYLLMFLLLVGGFGIYHWTLKRQTAWELEREQAGYSARLAASAMENTIEGIMITDAQGRIVSVNKAFTNITGYAEQEVVGKIPAMLGSGQHGDAFYADMWDKLRETENWQGEIWDRRKSGETYAQLLSISAVRANNREVTHYVGVFNDISQYKDYEARLEYLVNHDPLTKLPNRTLLNDRLDEAISRAKRYETHVCVMFVDLDRFKFVNDSLGHGIGDKMLQAVARRLLAGVRESDTVARLGGDEFTIILERLHSTDDAALIAQKLLESLVAPLEIDDHELYISASMGISFYPPDGQDAQTLLRNADTAMYRAKEEGRNKCKFFSSDMNLRAQEYMVMANSLHAALGNHELFLEYQPRIDLASGKMVGVEALIRWNHPELGRIPPDRFIPLAEETGLIIGIGEWVIRTACQKGKAWIDAGYPLRVAVNLSPRQFRRHGFVKSMLSIIQETGYRRDLLDVEITESLMMEDPESVKQILQELHDHGIKIAIDDFGTGYSSLNYLKQFPIDYIKIDKSFVRDIPADADSVVIVSTIIAMAKNLRLSLIVEGVETGQQSDHLRAEGCEEAQGYYFSRPVSAANIEAMLAGTSCAET